MECTLIARIELRKRAGLRQADLAEAAGVSIPSVSRWERGLLNLNDEALDRIARTLQSRLKDTPVFENAKELTAFMAEDYRPAMEAV
jgi:transcriptional regulator with XRE-family HTH domain